ncbi:inositol monophosphatase family protein [Crossiella equi]|nr:inositol monophosphatase family protein [Crossiella equi]
MYQTSFLSSVAQKATEVGYEIFRSATPEVVQDKNDRDIVTEVDLKIEREIRDFLATITPKMGFHGEEEGVFDPSENDGWRWVLDPIDGTSNFVRNLPICGISLAAVHGDSVVVSAVALPFMNLQYGAAFGLGAYVNGKRLTPSRTSDLSKAMVSIGDYAVGDGAEDRNQRRFAITENLAKSVERIRMLGSAAVDLVWVAEGRLDAAVIMANHVWDTAAGALIAREAGALVIDAQGQEHTSASTETIAVAPGLADALLRTIRSA